MALCRIFSLCLLLELTVSLVSGQTLGDISSNSGTTTGVLTDRILQFSEVGVDRNAGLRCATDNVENTVWQTPDGTAIENRFEGPAGGSELFTIRDSGIIALVRGPNYLSPDGQYCCVGTVSSQRRCVWLTACPTLGTRNLGTLTYNAEDNTATTNCFEGIAGAPFNMVLTCTTSTWSGDQPPCFRICPDLTLDNGMITYQYPNNGATVTANYPNTIATHTCNTGYQQSGGSTRTCEDNAGGANMGGTWSGSTISCTRVNCGNPPAVTNGAVLSMTGTTLFEDTVTYSCNNGYQLIGSATITCQANMTWTTEPTCLPVDCGPLTNPTNGQVVTSGTTFTSTATYTCNAGYILNGAGTRTCQANGTWSGTDPTCEELCPRQSLTNGMVTYSNEAALLPVGTVATYSCDSGYELARSQTRTCVAVIGWSVALPVCNPVNCTSLPNPANGTVDTSSGITFMSVAVYSCDPGFTQVGPETRTCQADASWSGVEPICQRAAPDGGIIAAVIIVVIIIIGAIMGVIVAVVLVRRRRQNQIKYAPALKEGTLPPAKPTPYSTKYTKAKREDQEELTVFKTIEPSVIDFPVDTCAVEGKEVYLKVKVGGHPPPTLTWYHNGSKVVADYATELDDDGGITFPSVEKKHEGTYKLVVSGESGGTIERQVELTVRDDQDDLVVSNSDINLGPVTVDQLGGYVSEMHASGNLQFKENYKAVDSGERGHEVTVAKIPENKLRNRFGNIAVYDDNRIVLQPITGRDDCQSEYINACYVDGYTIPRKFIATQGPIPRTLVDFWRLIWQERPPIIVMLTNLKEGNKIKCQPYWPESGKKSFGPFTVTITDQQVLADYTVRTLKVNVEGERKVLKTTQFHFTTWPDHGVPDYATPILGFHRRVKSQHNPSKGPLLVHCSAGVGRTGTYIVIDNVLDQIAAEGIVDISGTIVKARNQRMKLVQTQDQYVFIHDAILESVTCGDTQVNAGDLRKQMQTMDKVAPGKSVTGYQYQFQILQQVSPNPSEVNCSVALKSKNKNRSNKYLPADNSRVILKGEQPDYIHAVFAHGYKHQKAYIIAQNPLPSTVRNFWKVIYDRKCAAVVMLTPLKEDGQEVCSQYWPEDGQVTGFGEYTVDNLGEESNPGFTIRQLSVLSEKTQRAHQVTQFHITNWRSDGSCDNLKIVTDINEDVTKVQRRTGNKSIVVHCSDTATRSGMYCSIATTIDRCKTEGVVDVFQVVKALRVHKPGAVPSVDNYKDVFEAVLVYLDSFDTYANFQDM